MARAELHRGIGSPRRSDCVCFGLYRSDGPYPDAGQVHNVTGPMLEECPAEFPEVQTVWQRPCPAVCARPLELDSTLRPTPLLEPNPAPGQTTVDAVGA